MTIYGTSEWEQKNRLLKIEINKNKVNIDRSVFVKTDLEKIQLAEAKSRFKNK
jgi:hypothetical protein